MLRGLITQLAFMGAIASVHPSVISHSTPPAPVKFCQYIDRWRGTNVPISPASEETDIIHAVALIDSDDVVGWVAYRRDAKPWYFDGPITHRTASKRQSTRVLDLLGLTNMRVHTWAKAP